MLEKKEANSIKELVDIGLQNARKELLDLSGRNRLLNFKHTSAKILRFVDTQPNHVYSELVNNYNQDKKADFLIAPVPLPKKSEYETIDEKTDAKTLSLNLFPEHEKITQKINAKTHAGNLGISTDWEVSPDVKLEQKNILQTLYFPEELDRVVRRIQSEARTAIEESGVNMLFLCLGFLKWSDSENSDIFNYSPLIMIPVEIERDKLDAKTGFAKFILKYSGDDILDNICLREKLKQLAIELPTFEEFESPEEYFSVLINLINDIKPNWTIHRFVTLCFLSFGKMLMYLDLDPLKWDGLEDTHIGDIFSNNQSGESTIASEFDIDNDKDIPHISQVMDADSSQHSAIIDVINGKNLVIEGPPGTGKSQTITNLIAACLADGKTVLFVAEKLAALQVVRKRLDNIGLGHFCLELHSHKTQKKTILADLKKRLELNSTDFSSRANLAVDQLTELNKKKAKLVEYSKALNTEFCDMQETPHQIFWKTDVLQTQLSQQYNPENFIAPKHVAKLTLQEVRNQSEQIKNLADNIREYFGKEYQSSSHYWNGLNLSDYVEYGLQQDIFTSLQKLFSSANKAKESTVNLRQIGFFNIAFIKAKDLLIRLDKFNSNDFKHANLFEFLDTGNLETNLAQGLIKLQNYKKIAENYFVTLNEYNIKDESLSLVDNSVILGLEISESLKLASKISDILIMHKELESYLKCFASHLPTIKKASEYIGLSAELNKLETFDTIKVVSNFFLSVSDTELSLRHDLLEKASENKLFDECIKKIIKLREIRVTLEVNFIFEQLPQIELLINISTSLRNKKLLKILQWIEARSAYRKIARNDLCKNTTISAGKLDDLISYLQEVESFNNDADYIALLPSIFNGIETNIENLQIASNFYRKLRNHIAGLQFETQLYDIIKSMNSSTYEWFVHNNSIINEEVNGLSSISSSLKILGRIEIPNNLDLIIKISNGLIDNCKKLELNLASAKIPNDITIDKLSKLLIDKNSYIVAKENFNSDKVIQEIDFTDNKEKLSSQAEILEQLLSLIDKVRQYLPSDSINYFLCKNGEDNLLLAKESVNLICFYNEVLQDFYSLFSISNSGMVKKPSNDFWGYSGNDDNKFLDAVITKLELLDYERESFVKWCEVINGFAAIKLIGLDATINSFSNSTNKVPLSDYVPLFNYLLYYTLCQEMLRNNKILGSFARVTHENIRDSFKDIDIELQKLNSLKIAHSLVSRQIPEGLSGSRISKDLTDAKLIRYEIGKMKKHIPIRQLVAKAQNALTAMKPCFMMGPLSVAQYLPPSNVKFDIVIIDEASQIKPEDSIGVLSRAKQVVVVGDSNQLPPTGFFDAMGDDIDDAETIIQDSESILDVCKPLFQPIRRLRWHYRSQHQSLIAFSNKHFYDNDLIIFPSPTAHSDILGVRHVYVNDGIYTNQSNPMEAKRVVSEILQMIEQNPNLSYGIVTLNAKQKMIIEDEVERARKCNPIFDDYVSKSEDSDEDFFVKNLENVQGDERDVIFISTTFGCDEKGVFRQAFGPINGKNGWRRLNVLFTRAKQHVRIFSSFLPERIRVDDTKEQRGLKALKDYLNFAITGIDNHSYLTKQEPDSDFERAVGSFLIKNGYDVVYQLGVAGYRIDIVVKHPQSPTDYIIAIECDGATYHSARSARDRDRLREENLRKLGWNHIHRIWSTDWFRKREQEEKRLLQAVEIALFAI